MKAPTGICGDRLPENGEVLSLAFKTAAAIGVLTVSAPHGQGIPCAGQTDHLTLNKPGFEVMNDYLFIRANVVGHGICKAFSGGPSVLSPKRVSQGVETKKDFLAVVGVAKVAGQKALRSKNRRKRIECRVMPQNIRELSGRLFAHVNSLNEKTAAPMGSCGSILAWDLGHSSSTSRSLASIWPPGWTWTALTTASRSACRPVSIFIASMVSKRSPSCTCWPT